jgi:hypothetical protein
MTKNITSLVEGWLNVALAEDQDETGEGTAFAVSLVVFPDYPSNENLLNDMKVNGLVPIPALVLYLEIPGPTPDRPIYTAITIPPFGLVEQTVKSVVLSTLSTLRESRSKYLEEHSKVE